MLLPPTVSCCTGVSGIGREGDGGMSREFFNLDGVDGMSSSDE